MFEKLHKKLTLLCSVITTGILLVMSAAFLLVSENSQRQNSFLSFCADMGSLLTGMEEQDALSHSLLKKLEGSKYRIYLWDNGQPFLFSSLSSSKEEQKLCASILSHYKKLQGQDFPKTLQPLRSEFAWSAAQNAECPLHAASHYASVMTWLRNGMPITAVVLATQTPLRRHLLLQRLRFLLLDLIGGLLFFSFSWFFTGKLLEPVQKNHERQAWFIASASHELRTPLSVILACVSTCEAAPPAEHPRFFAAIRREGQRMQGLLADMLFLANDQNGQKNLPKEEVDLETLLLNLYENFEPLAQKSRHFLSVSLPEDSLAPCSCNKEKIVQLMSIFLENAFSYTPPGGLVSLTLREDAKNAYLSVADTGPGIPDAQKELVFLRFYRMEKAHSQKNHFGLGLCIAADIAKAHGGRIDVSDNRPCGTIFTLVLPLHS